MARKPGTPVVYLRKGSDLYWCSFTVNGKRHRVSTGTRHLGTAEETAQRLHAEASLGRRPVAHRRISHAAATSLEMLSAEYIVWTRANGRADSYVVKQESHFRAHFLPRWKRIGQLCTEAIETYKVERTAEGCGSVTLYKELVTLNRFMRWCRRVKGVLEVIPAFDRVRPVSTYRPPNLAPEDVARLIAAIPDRNTHRRGFPAREFYTCQWAQAFRPGELESLRWADVDLRNKRLTVQEANDKARVGRTIGMAHETYAILSEMHRSAQPLPTAFVFGKCSFRKSLQNAAKACGLPHVTPHNFRHFRLSELGENTTDVGSLQFFAGHKHLATTDVYVHSRTARTEEMLKALDRRKP